MDKGWKESVDSGERIYGALMDTGVKMTDQGRTTDGNRCFEMGSEVLAAVIELQKYLCADPTGDDEIDRATEALAAIDKRISVPDTFEDD